jgi:hypothetical protein
MTAIAGNAGDILRIRRLALRAAIILIFLNRAAARFVVAFVIICHQLKSSLVR